MSLPLPLLRCAAVAAASHFFLEVWPDHLALNFKCKPNFPSHLVTRIPNFIPDNGKRGGSVLHSWTTDYINPLHRVVEYDGRANEAVARTARAPRRNMQDSLVVALHAGLHDSSIIVAADCSVWGVPGVPGVYGDIVHIGGHLVVSTAMCQCTPDACTSPTPECLYVQLQVLHVGEPDFTAVGGGVLEKWLLGRGPCSAPSKGWGTHLKRDFVILVLVSGHFGPHPGGQVTDHRSRVIRKRSNPSNLALIQNWLGVVPCMAEVVPGISLADTLYVPRCS